MKIAPHPASAKTSSPTQTTPVLSAKALGKQANGSSSKATANGSSSRAGPARVRPNQAALEKHYYDIEQENENNDKLSLAKDPFQAKMGKLKAAFQEGSRKRTLEVAAREAELRKVSRLDLLLGRC